MVSSKVIIVFWSAGGFAKLIFSIGRFANLIKLIIKELEKKIRKKR